MPIKRHPNGSTIAGWLTDEEAAAEDAAALAREARGEYPHVCAIPLRAQLDGARNVTVRISTVEEFIARGQTPATPQE